ncbi:MAG: TldD/PmbA family protein [Bacteroidales bacterium]|nr:TldD/PmbA family protein [Bacteroidales bacterium]
MNKINKQQQNFNELADWVIDRTLKSGANGCKVNLSKTRFVDIIYRERRPDVIKEATTQSLSLEVFVNNRYASQSTPDLRKTTLESFINDVIDNAKIVEEDPFRTLPDPEYYKGQTNENLLLNDPSYGQHTPEERHDIVKKVEDACLKNGGDKVISVEAEEYDQHYEEYVKTSNGFEGSTESTEFWAGAEMTAQDEGDRRPNGYNYMGSRYFGDLPSLNDIGRIAAERTLDLMGGNKIPSETLPVIIESRNVATIGNGFLNALAGANIQQKRSFLADKRGQKVASDVFTVIDDPFIPKAFGSKYYDGDGFPARRRELITKGTINEFLIGWYYSRKLECEPTSSSVSNLIIPPGHRSVDEIIKELGRCILITDFIGGNSNSTTGDFSIGIIGKLYDKGQFVQSVAEMNIADNHLNFWNKLVEAANDPWIYSSARLPSLVFEDVIVAGV